MSINIEHESTFSRNVANIGKAGAYYTDKEHCRKIGKLVKFPEEFNILEPSVGDGSAVLSFLGENRESANLFGIELNGNTFNELEQNKVCNYTLHADFLNDVKISQCAFSCMFANPPYGEYKDGVRFEQAFAEKAFSYLKKNALVIYVIPHYVLTDEKFIRSFFARYEPMETYRFEPKEFEKWKQVCVIARRRESIAYRKTDLELYLSAVDLDKLEFIPEVSEPTYTLPSSRDDDVKFFTNLTFDAEIFVEAVNRSVILGEFGRNCAQEYRAVAAGNPPLPLTKENAYMLGVCGAGSGLAGNEDEGTLHLQRGVVENVTTRRIEPDENGSNVVVETVTSSTSMHILDSMMDYYELKE